MHIGSGIFEGKELKDPLGSIPVSPRALTLKEEIFTIISTRVSEAFVLDINDFNGMYGIESLSRGATCCRFVNFETKESDCIKENLVIIGVDPRGLVFNEKINDFLVNPTLSECVAERYDVIFFSIRDKKEISDLKLVLGRQKPSGITVVIYPNSPGFSIPENIGGFKVVENREFEDKKVAVLMKVGL